nr:putative 3'-5' exonuclease [Megavirus caiporensis]
MITMDNEELILTINKIISYIKENGPSKMHLIDAHIKNNNSKHPIWRRHKLSLGQFLSKFPSIFLVDTNSNVNLQNIDSDNINPELIIQSWNFKIDDKTLLEQKFNRQLATYQFPINRIITISSDCNVVNEWIKINIYDYGIKYIGFDTETFMTGQTEKISIIQISTINVDLIVQVNIMDSLPTELIRLLSDFEIIKVGVSIVDDMISIQKYFANPLIQSVLDLSDLSKDIFDNLGNKNNIGLKTLAAVTMNIYLPDKDLSEIKKSNWNAETLTQKQIEYAVTDSYISLIIYYKMIDGHNVDPNKYLKICEPIIDVVSNKQHCLTKKEIKQKEELKKKTVIDSRIKRWYHKDDSPEFIFEPMNSFYRQYTHVAAKKYSGVTTETIGIDPNRCVVVKRLTSD